MSQKHARVHKLTISKAAEFAGVSVRLMNQAVNVHRHGCAELQAAVKDGLISMRLATEIIKFDPKSQALIVAELHDVTPRSRAGLVEMLLADSKRQRVEVAHA